MNSIDIAIEYIKYHEFKELRSTNLIKNIADYISVNYSENEKNQLAADIKSVGGSYKYCKKLVLTGALKESRNSCSCNGGTFEKGK